MSNSKTAIGEIKKLMVQFGFLTEKETEMVAEIFVDAKLVDGTVVKVEGDAVVEGAKVLVVTADSEVPAPDGVHELEDGTKIETKDGIIAAVAEAAAEVPVEVPEMEEPEVEVEVKKEGMESEVVALLKELVVKLGEKIAALEGKVEGMNAEFSAFRKEPGAKKIADGKTAKFNKVDDYNDILDAKVASIMSLRNN
jgi:hypothetical protein